MNPLPVDWRSTLAAALISLLTFTGCSQEEGSTTTESQSATTQDTPTDSREPETQAALTDERLADSQTFTHRIQDGIASLDPHRFDNDDEARIIRDLFEGLLNLDAQGRPVPGVAHRFESSNDHQRWTFHLRQDAVWSDGEPVVAGDFVYAWQRAVDPSVASPNAWYLQLMAIKNAKAVIKGQADPSALGVQAIDDHTLTVELTRPTPYFPTLVTHPVTFPVPNGVIDQYGDRWTQPGNLVGNGAFTLTEHNLNRRLIRERHVQYWDNEHNRMDRVITRVIHDDDQALSHYDSGELDATRLPSKQYSQYKTEQPAHVKVIPRLCTYYFTFNNQTTPLNDDRVRRALSYAIDRERLVEGILQGHQIPAYTMTPPLTNGFSPKDTAFSTMTQSQRDARARELMLEAGYGTDNPLHTSLVYNPTQSHRDIAIAVQSMWQNKLGVTTTLSAQDWSHLLTTRSRGDYQIARSGRCGDYNEASTFLTLMHSASGYNDANYESEPYDRMFEDSRLDENPNEAYAQLEKMIARDMPNAPIYHYTDAMMLKPYVKGWPLGDITQTVYSKDLYIIEH